MEPYLLLAVPQGTDKGVRRYGMNRAIGATKRDVNFYAFLRVQATL
jgi:hypothetical protein